MLEIEMNTNDRCPFRLYHGRVFLLYSINAVSYSDRISAVKTSLHSWNEPSLVMVHPPFHTASGLIAWCLAPDCCAHVYERGQPVISGRDHGRFGRARLTHAVSGTAFPAAPSSLCPPSYRKVGSTHTLVVDLGKGPHSSSFQAWGLRLGVLCLRPHLSSEYGGEGLGGSHLTNIPEMNRELGLHPGSFQRLCFPILSSPSAPISRVLFLLPLPLSPSLSLPSKTPHRPLLNATCVHVCVCTCTHMNPATVPTAGRCWKRLTPPVTHLLWSDSGLYLPQPLPCLHNPPTLADAPASSVLLFARAATPQCPMGCT